MLTCRLSRTVLCVSLVAILFSAALFGGFNSSEIFLPSVAKVAGAGGSQFYTTVWVTNLGASTVNFTFELLLGGQANPSPVSFSDTLAAGETKAYEDVIGNTFHLATFNGGGRIITADGELFVSERIYNQLSGTPLSATAGQFYSGVPKGFSIGSGESASLQGVYLGSSQDFRYNYALLETSGQSCSVHVQALDENGIQLGATDVPLKPYEQLLLKAGDLASTASSTNARITATVTSGTGTVVLAGSQVGNSDPQDQSGFEMSFKDSLLGGGGGGGGVTSLNGLAGAVTIAHGANTTVNVNGSTITIDAVSGSGTGLTAVSHDNSLSGSGTTGLPLGIAGGQVVRSFNGLHDAVTLAPGSNITLTPSGNTITIDAVSGSGAGLTAVSHDNSLNGSGTAALPLGIAGGQVVRSFNGLTDAVTLAPGSNITLTPSGNTVTIAGTGLTLPFSGTGSNIDPMFEAINAGDGTGVSGKSSSTDFPGVEGQNEAGVGVFGVSVSGKGIFGQSTSGDGAVGQSGSLDGVYGTSQSGDGVFGTSTSGDGVFGTVAGAGRAGISGHFTATSGAGYGVFGQSASLGGYGVYSNGNMAATGTKSFVEPHPTDPTKEIRFVCLEGPESGTYFRGSAKIVNGFATIDVPESFRMVTAANAMTIQLTPVGAAAVLFCVKKSLDQIVIQGNADVDFDYMVNGVRKAFADFQPISENTDFVPRSNDTHDLIAGLPPESVRRLMASGILNEDGSINLDTAHRLGWDQRPGWNDAPESR